MALINTGPDYTRSGENFLTRWSNMASFLPIPFINTTLVAVLGYAGTALDTVGWLARGKLASAATVAAAGVASTTVNSIGGTFWWLNAGSGLATGHSAGTHARALTETLVGGAFGVIGQKPTVTRSYTAGIGSIGGAQASGPGYYASRVADERGQDRNAAWSNYRTGAGAEHVSALENARAMGANAQRNV